MKTLAIAFALVMFAATASAGESAVSPTTLDSMGLGSMQVMSDTEGLAVRGKGPLEDMFGARVPQLLGDSLSSLSDMLGHSFDGFGMGDQVGGGFQSLIGGLPLAGDAFDFGGSHFGF